MRSEPLKREEARIALRILGLRLPTAAAVLEARQLDYLLSTGAALKISHDGKRLVYRLDGYAQDGHDVQDALDAIEDYAHFSARAAELDAQDWE